MSYDFAVWQGERPDSAEEAEEQFAELAERFIEGDDEHPPTPAIRAFADAATLAFTQSTDSPWAFEPLLDDAHGPLLVIACRWDRAEDVKPRLAELAHQHGLVCLDMSASELLT